MEKLHKTWETPQLIIIAKGNPEEKVLTHCKTMNPNQPFTGPDLYTQQLTCAAGDLGKCDVCQARAASGS